MTSNNLTFEQLPYAVAQLFDKLSAIESLLLGQLSSASLPEVDALLNLEQAASFLNLAKPTMYGLIQRKEIPSMKRGNRLYFSQQELIMWVKAGRKLTKAELDQEAEVHLANRRGGRQS